MIAPTIGRVVLFTPNRNAYPDNTQPWPALICFVHSDSIINVAGFTNEGAAFSGVNIPLLQSDSDTRPIDSGYAAWMPYQQAKAAEDAAKTTTAAKAPNLPPVTK